MEEAVATREKPKMNIVNRRPVPEEGEPEKAVNGNTLRAPQDAQTISEEPEPAVDEERLDTYLQEAVSNIEMALDSIADMREKLAGAGAEACGDAFSKSVLLSGVYMMQSHFPDAVGEDGMIDAAKLPVQGNENLLGVIDRYNTENEKTANQDAGKLEAACESTEPHAEPMAPGGP